MDPIARVLKLFRLTIPPLFFLLTCFVFLGEHVFGLAYVIGKRLKPRMRITLRVFYQVGTSFAALCIHIALLYTCGGTASVCPPVRFEERACLACTSASAVYCGATLLMERWANPMLGLNQPTGLRVRACSAAGLMVLWMCIGEKQLCAQLLLLLFTARRALALFPTSDQFYGLCIKCYATIHMSRILTRECAGVSRLAVATVAAMTAL